MARHVFFSFHYDPDNWRAAKVRGINAVTDGEQLVDNDWESVRKKSSSAIESWIGEQIKGTSCTVVLIGSQTAHRPWVRHEILNSWEKRSQGLVGIHIHKLLNRNLQPSSKGPNPFSRISMDDGSLMSDWVDVYDPPQSSSSGVYNHIMDNLAAWVESAIDRR